MSVPWAVGTDAGEEVRKRLSLFIETWLANPKYKTRLPKVHWRVLDEGKRENAGVVIRVVAQADPAPPRTFITDAGRVVEDWHQVGVFVKCDQKSGGAKNVSAFYGALRSLLVPLQLRHNESLPAERLDLDQAGLFNVRENTDGIVSSPDAVDGEIMFAKQSLQLRLSTDCYQE